jgi:uncharacterized protein (DUF2141 family)
MWRSAAALACLALVGAANPDRAAPVPGPAAGATGALDIEVTNLRSKKGVIRVCITSDAKDFPDCRNGASAIKRTIAAATPRLRVDGLAPGTYAIAIIHDENSNSKLDTFAGIPREGFGFSRNPKIGFGPPKFSAASFAVGAAPGSQQVKVRYLL